MPEETLNDIMEFGTVVDVFSSGRIDRNVPEVRAPESYIEAHWDKYGDPHVMEEHRKAYRDSMERAGWEIVRQPKSFGTYGDGFMDPAEYIGGWFEQEIRENPGTYVAVTIEVLALTGDARYENDSPEPYGWVVLRKRVDD